MRLIDADALRMLWLDEDPNLDLEINTVLESIDEQPTVEAEPVRHGTWETVLYEQSGRLNSYAHACPRCKYVYKDFKPIGYNYCPNCGKPMDGGVSND